MDYPIVFICQRCGRAAAESAIVYKTWLIEPHVNVETILIIRCPHHISEHSMRLTAEGRTNRLREKAAYGKGLVLPPFSRSDPLPVNFIGANRG